MPQKKMLELDLGQILNLGLSTPPVLSHFKVKTVPIIKIEPHPYTEKELKAWHVLAKSSDHWLFSSKTAVSLFFTSLPSNLRPKKIIAVGEATAKKLKEHGCTHVTIAKEETQEGMLGIIEETLSEGSSLFWARSKGARPFLARALREKGFHVHEMPLYSVEKDESAHPLDLCSFQSILFTAPSTVDAFLALYREFPRDKRLLVIGPITHEKLLREVKKSCAKDLPEILMMGEII